MSFDDYSGMATAEEMARFRHQARARSQVQRAIRCGDLVREPCAVCGREPAEGHHDDYDKPLEVRWLCRTHHRAISAYGQTVEEIKAEWLELKAARA